MRACATSRCKSHDARLQRYHTKQSNLLPDHPQRHLAMPPLNKDWELELQFNPRELSEPYELYFFLGPVPPLVANWRDSPSRLFEPITSQAYETTTEFRELNGYLEAHYGDNLKDSDVMTNLRKDLSWGVKKVKSHRASTSRFSSQCSPTSTRRLKPRG